MKTSNLHDFWAAPDNTRLTPKQFSLRLPVHVAAKIAALCEMYPHKNRTQIVADLLTAALADLEQNLPMELGEPLNREEERNERMVADYHGYEYVPLYGLGGPRGRFRNIANRHYEELEAEIGNSSQAPLYPAMYITEQDLKK